MLKIDFRADFFEQKFPNNIVRINFRVKSVYRSEIRQLLAELQRDKILAAASPVKQKCPVR